MKALPALLLVAASSLTVVHADCRMPKGPDTIPDGRLATLEEMQAAMKAVKQFDADVGAYQTCLENEHNEVMAREGDKLTEQQKKERARILAQKQNAAADEAQALANRFNEQVKVYREKNKKQ